MANNDKRVLNYAVLTPEELINYAKYERYEMANEQKIKLIKWIEFGISCIAVLAKFIKEIVEHIPEKGA